MITNGITGDQVNGTNGRLEFFASNQPGSGSTTNLWRISLHEQADGDWALQHFNGQSWDSILTAKATGTGLTLPVTGTFVSSLSEYGGTTGGTTTAYTITPATPWSAYTDGMVVLFKANATNTGAAATFAVSGLAALPSTMGSVALPVGGLVINNFYWGLVETGGTSFRVTPFDAASVNGDTFNNPITLPNAGLQLLNPAGTFYVQPTASAEVANRVLTIPLLGAADTLVTLGTAQTMGGAKTFPNAGLLIQNPAATFTVQPTPSAEVANRILTIPLLGADDTIVTLGTTQAITGIKTITNPTTAVGTNGIPSMTLTTGGTVMTTPTAGVIEADAAAFYKTLDITNGRAFDDRWNYFRLTGVGGGITTIADFFGSNDGIGNVASGVYEIEWHCYWAHSVTGTGTITWTIVATTNWTNLVAEYVQCPVAGIATVGAPQTAGVIASAAASSIALPVTGANTAVANHYAKISSVIESGTAGNIRLKMTASAGTATPARDSFFRVRRLPALNAGTFVA